MLFLIANTLSFAEVPHSYVTENPKKEIQKVETFKQREKAELNLSVTKLKTKEIEGKLVNGKLVFDITDKKDIQEGNILVTQGTPYKPNNARIRSANPTQILEATKEANKLEVTGENLQDVYVNVLDSKGQLAGIYKNIINFTSTDYTPYYTEGLGMLYNKNYDELGWGNFHSLDEIIFDSRTKYGNNTFIKKISGTNRVKVAQKHHVEGNLAVVIYGYNKEGQLVYTSPSLGKLTSYSAETYNWAEVDWNITLPDHYIIIMKTVGTVGNPKNDNSQGNNTLDVGQVFNVVLDDFIHKANGESNLVIDESYQFEYLKFDSCTIENLKPLSITNSVKGARITSTTGEGLLHLDSTDTLEINGQKHTLTSENLSEQKLQIDKINLAYKIENGKFQLKVVNYGLKVNSPQIIDIKIVKNKDIKDVMEHKIYLTVPYIEMLIGDSTLTFAEYYPVNEFVQFTANPTIQNALPLALDNSVKDVTLETTGKGLVAMQQGDKLTVDGHEVVIGAGGNIGPQKLTIGNVKYTYEVKNGKFRIALNEWGVLEPNRTIPIKIVRNENGSDKSLAEHNLTIKAPRKVEGTSNVKLNQDYSIRNTIRFNGISLQGAGALGLENPIPLGVSLTSTAGQGIPFMKEGDRLEISDGLTTRSTYSTRGVKAFTIGPNGTLGKQQVKLNNGELTVFVEGGKLRVGVNNWLVNNTINSNVRLVRGTNEIMNHTLDIKVPEAPFNVKKNGLLDFGNVTAGSKRTAETDIVLEMLQDVSDVKFSLKDPQPILENLGTGDNLKVNRIEYLVSKQGKKDYRVKLKGNLIIPEETKSGLYTGSTVLELKIK